ncbi:MAG: hypothetical protein PHZ26_01570 [Candidatus Gracilibacteria bacterium]|nr:hypothetical protein [Candidatus Gracilibacteria bacterium]MDD2908422.1 hypothetical protein [Candidatus Gracilibacteria bacterium]
MKKSILITGAVLIGGLAIIASTAFAGAGNNSFAGQGRGAGQGFARSNSGVVNSNYSVYGSNIVRTVTNITNGAEVTMTTTDAATLEHMKSMFTQNALKASKNTLINVERTELSNGTKLTITSTDTSTIKSIQERAASAKSGAFGKAGQGKGGMMKNGSGKGQGRGNGSCPMAN